MKLLLWDGRNFCIFLGGNPYTPHFAHKLKNSSELVARLKRPWYVMFDGVVDKKEVSTKMKKWLQKCHYNIVEKLAFS